MVTISHLRPTRMLLKTYQTLLLSNPLNANCGKYLLPSALFLLPYMEYTFISPPYCNPNSYNALPTTRHTFSMPPVAEKTRRVKKRIFFCKNDKLKVEGSS